MLVSLGFVELVRSCCYCCCCCWPLLSKNTNDGGVLIAIDALSRTGVLELFYLAHDVGWLAGWLAAIDKASMCYDLGKRLEILRSELFGGRAMRWLSFFVSLLAAAAAAVTLELTIVAAKAALPAGLLLVVRWLFAAVTVHDLGLFVRCVAQIYSISTSGSSAGEGKKATYYS